MRIFDWFRGTPPSHVTRLPDVIWLTKVAKLAGIARGVSDALSRPDRPDAVLLVAHFGDSLGEIQTLVDEGRVAGPVAVVRVAELGGGSAGLSLGESRTVLIVVGERHPLRSHDEAVREFAERLPCRSRLVHHVSLDEPLMQVFAGGWVTSMLRKLGQKEDEAIESQLVARRIRDAQRKLAPRCRTDFPADSAEAWMAWNCPNA